MIRRALLALIPLALAATTAWPAEVALRSATEVLSGEITAITDQTLTLRVTTASERAVTELPWTDIRAVTGQPPETEDLSPYLAAGADIWRAHQRLARLDAPGALPLLERHRARYLGRAGPVSDALARGLASCLYWRGDTEGATAAWLAVLAAAESKRPASEPNNAAVYFLTIDADTQLAAELPPAFADASAAQRFLDVCAPMRAHIDPASRAGTILDLYSDAARAELADPDTHTSLGARHDGLRLELVRAFGRDEAIMTLADAVGAVVGNPETRDACRTRLRALIARRPPDWTAAWCGLALGRSLAREHEPDQQRLGIVESLDTALRRAADHPTLAGLALADAARAARALGDTDAARTFESEFNARYPGHPAADTLDADPQPAQGTAG